MKSSLKIKLFCFFIASGLGIYLLWLRVNALIKKEALPDGIPVYGDQAFATGVFWCLLGIGCVSGSIALLRKKD